MEQKFKKKFKQSIADACPHFIPEWHPTKNGDLTPKDVSIASHNLVWWVCTNDHEWEGKPHDRSRKTPSNTKNSSRPACPYCAGKRVWPTETLAILRPELVEEWHAEKNGDLSPNEVGVQSYQKVWWKCRRIPQHEWKTGIYLSTQRGYGCPHCRPSTSREQLRIFAETKSIFPDTQIGKIVSGIELDVYIPSIKIAIELDGGFWHLNRLGKDAEKNRKAKSLGVRIIRIRGSFKGEQLPLLTDIDVPQTSQALSLEDIKQVFLSINRAAKLDHSQQAKIEEYQYQEEFIDPDSYQNLASLYPGPLPGKSLLDIAPDWLKEWHPTKNGELNPANFTTGSGEMIWWHCADDHEWQAVITNRNKGKGCPYCSGLFVSDANRLSVHNPALSAEWHPTKNDDLAPFDVSFGSGQLVWWCCNKGHEWQAKVNDRQNGNGCPYCSNKKILASENSLAALQPAIASEWNYKKNTDDTPESVGAGSAKRVWWTCSNKHDWLGVIGERSRKNTSCPLCSSFGYLYANIADELHPTKNSDFDPMSVKPKSHKKVWWQCRVNKSHVWLAQIGSRAIGKGCPFCKGSSRGPVRV